MVTITWYNLGFGDSAGYPSETGIVSDSMFLFNYTKNLAGKNYIFIWGHSMGTGYAKFISIIFCIPNM